MVGWRLLARRPVDAEVIRLEAAGVCARWFDAPRCEEEVEWEPSLTTLCTCGLRCSVSACAGEDVGEARLLPRAVAPKLLPPGPTRLGHAHGAMPMVRTMNHNERDADLPIEMVVGSARLPVRARATWMSHHLNYLTVELRGKHFYRPIRRPSRHQ